MKLLVYSFFFVVFLFFYCFWAAGSNHEVNHASKSQLFEAQTALDKFCKNFLDGDTIQSYQRTLQTDQFSAYAGCLCSPMSGVCKLGKHRERPLAEGNCLPVRPGCGRERVNALFSNVNKKLIDTDFIHSLHMHSGMIEKLVQKFWLPFIACALSYLGSKCGISAILDTLDACNSVDSSPLTARLGRINCLCWWSKICKYGCNSATSFLFWKIPRQVGWPTERLATLEVVQHPRRSLSARKLEKCVVLQLAWD